MADEPNVDASIAAPVVAPVVEVPTPAPASAPVTEAPKPVEEPSKTASPFEMPTLLEEAAKPQETKAAEAKPGDVKPGEIKSPEPAKVEFKPYELPEGVKLPDKEIGEFNTLLAKDMPPQERGQALVSMYVSEMQKYADRLAQQQLDVFAQTRADWRKRAMGDEEIGGAGWRTTEIAIAEMRDLFVTEPHRKAFNDFLRSTGAGDHPEFHRFLWNVSRKFSEPAPTSAPFRPPADIGRAPGAGGRRATIYDHETSQRRRDK